MEKLNSNKSHKSSLFCIWITPLRSLSKQIQLSIQDFLNDMCDEFSVEVRNGDTSLKDRARQAKKTSSYFDYNPREFSAVNMQQRLEKENGTGRHRCCG